MKRSGFKNKANKPLKRSGFKRATVGGLKGLKRTTAPRRGTGRVKLPKLSKLQKDCDKLLTPICKKTTPYCEACGKHTEVGHHWIEKSRSSYLRYDLRNIVALCNSCHAKIHNRFGNSVVGGLDVAQTIIKKRGKTWKMQMDADQPKYIKVDRAFYVCNLARLTGIHDSLFDK